MFGFGCRNSFSSGSLCCQTSLFEVCGRSGCGGGNSCCGAASVGIAILILIALATIF